MIAIVKNRIRGTSYSFEVSSIPYRRRFLFTIRTIHNSSRRTSIINNLNPILSEFGINEVDQRFSDPDWMLSEKESLQFGKDAKQLLSDKFYREYMEKILDDDRSQGEWENFEIYEHE